MQSFNKKKFYSFRADANALGGFLEEPSEKIIPTLAPVSLPAVGGFATARSEAFNLDDIVSCSSAYTRVSGREHANGSISILTTAVVEDLNILEVVTAERIVTQISISIPSEQGAAQISLAGSRFEGLQLAGRDARPNLNLDLQRTGSDKGGAQELPLTWRDIQRVGREQAETLIKCFKDRRDEGANQWAVKRHGWMTSDRQPVEGGNVLCSLVDGFEGVDPKRCCGHIVEIPGFGRIILGELRVSRDSVQLVAIRAELGCPVSGQVGVCSGGGGGSGDTS